MKTSVVLFLLAVAGLCVALGRTRPQTKVSRFGDQSALDRIIERWHPRLGFIALLCTGVSAVLAFTIVQDWRSPVALSEFITVYPNAEADAWAPGISREKVWLFSSPDSLRAIGDFYETVARDDQWDLDAAWAGDVLHLQLRRQNTRVTILAEWYETHAEISYQVVNLGQ